MAKPSGIWDVHHHWVNEVGYIDRLLKTMDRLQIERVGLIAMGEIAEDLFLIHPPREGCAGNDELAHVIKKHPDRIWGWGFIRLGRHENRVVDRLAGAGMAGLKFHAPLKPYDDPEFFPVYDRAQQLGLPCLFHTGIFSPPKPMPGQGFRSENCRPVYLETIAQEFPDLKMICAHLGVCWNEEAATICRICTNIYADLSGRVDGWRASKSIQWYQQILYWPTAHQKVLFGSDVHADEMEEALDDYSRIFSGLGWDEDQLRDAFYNNARRLFSGDDR
tara:strand:+ start:2583 stop:3410 length:828 start_codon:yes stop_codon:yes gene_type:complete